MLGFTQKEVAKILGITSTTVISRWENGRSSPDLKNLLKLSIIYKRLIDDLYFDLRSVMRSELSLSDISIKDSDKPP